MTELLVVSAVLAVLSALLFPVFRSAMEAAKRTQCISNFRQIGGALGMYQADYDDGVPPVNYRLVQMSNPTDDRTWVQTLLPYVGSMALFQCPADTGRNYSQPVVSAPAVPSGDDTWTRYYLKTLRSNLGYNYLYFSPLLMMPGGAWQSFPIKSSQVANASNTIVFIDSLWDRTNAGFPYGGGSWVVAPPCRYAESGTGLIDTFQFATGALLYFGFEPEGWLPKSTNSWRVYGGAWPWHRGRFNVMRVDGSVKSMALSGLTQGCDFQPNWRGTISSLSEYPWDLTE